MGAHKTNPTAIAAKNGELPPKPPKKSKRQEERELYALMYQYLDERMGLGEIYRTMNSAPYGMGGKR